MRLLGSVLFDATAATCIKPVLEHAGYEVVPSGAGPHLFHHKRVCVFLSFLNEEGCALTYFQHCQSSFLSMVKTVPTGRWRGYRLIITGWLTTLREAVEMEHGFGSTLTASCYGPIYYGSQRKQKQCRVYFQEMALIAWIWTWQVWNSQSRSVGWKFWKVDVTVLRPKLGCKRKFSVVLVPQYCSHDFNWWGPSKLRNIIYFILKVGWFKCQSYLKHSNI